MTVSPQDALYAASLILLAGYTGITAVSIICSSQFRFVQVVDAIICVAGWYAMTIFWTV